MLPRALLLPAVSLLALPLASPVFFVTPALAADASTVDPREVEAFKDTLERYTKRMGEFQADVTSQVDFQENLARSQVTDAYTVAVKRAQEQETALREMAIARLEAFLVKYPNTADTPEMLYRLADLRLEQSELEFGQKNVDYQRLVEAYSTNSTMAIPDTPTKNFSASIALYRQIIQKYPSYDRLPSAYYNLAYCLTDPLSAQNSPDAARNVNLEILERFPKPVVAAGQEPTDYQTLVTLIRHETNMLLGEYYFDLRGPPDDPTLNVRTAITYYEATLADGTEGRFYDKAIYKLAWSNYKLNNYDRALAYLVDVLDFSEDQVRETGKEAPFKKEALTYLAISYADIADREGKEPVDVAMAHVDQVQKDARGEREWAHDVVAILGDTLLKQAKHDDAVATYTYLQERWPLHPDNPMYQNKIALVYFGSPVPIKQGGRDEVAPAAPVKDDAAARAALSQLSGTYGEGSKWYEANKADAEAVARSRAYIEKSLADVATEFLIHAQETQSVADYALAAQKFKEFLAKVPFADDYDQYQWWLALSYYQAHQYDEAEKEYQQILKNDRSQFRDGARYLLMSTREQQVMQKFGSKEMPPADALVERVVTTPSGKELKVYMLSDEHKELIASYDDLSGREFTDPEFMDDLESNRVTMMYIAADIYYRHGHFDEARTRFDRLIALYPNKDQAAEAAGSYVDTFIQEENLQKVEAYSAKFKDMPLGESADVIARGRETFGTAQEEAAFNIAFDYVEKGDRAAAAQSFLDFMKRFPNSKNYKEALYNAANNLSLTGQATESNRLFETYIEKYPTDDLSKGLYLRIAGNYAAVLDLDKAVKYYEDLQKFFPDYTDSPDSLITGSFLRVGMGDHAGAAKGYEKYATTYSTRPDAEAAFWQAGVEWQKVSDAAALDFYERYLRRYPNANPDHVIEAQYNIAKIYERRGDTRRATAAWTTVQSTFRTYANSNISGATRSKAAEGALNQLLAQYEAFKVIKYTSNDVKNAELVVKTKPVEMQALGDRAIEIIQLYQDYETSVAALYIQGAARFTYADMVYNYPVGNLTEEEAELFRVRIDETLRLPAEEQGRRYLQTSLNKARDEKRWSEWNSKALDALHERFPLDYPSERQESRGVGQGSVVPLAGPETIQKTPENK